jgi:hypothetical protein
MENYLLIGDVHGKHLRYKDILDRTEHKTIQIGDFGFRNQHEWHIENIDNSKHKILFGNHDDYTFLNMDHSLGDYTILDNIMCVRGAYSIDRWCRTEGRDWFSNEELSYIEMNDIINIYETTKPQIMISHDCPEIVCKQLFGYPDNNKTRNGLQTMFEIYQPKLWIFGHHHKSIDTIIGDTRFICLNELETFHLNPLEY